MQSQNVAEYTEIRKEVMALKDCVTTYVGFVLAGSATAVWGLAERASDIKTEEGRIATALASILLSLVLVFVLFLLSYKFTSHNRYVGYSKILAHEQFQGTLQLPKSLFLWEICLDSLRDCNYQETLLENYCNSVQGWVFGVHNLQTRVQEQLTEKPLKSLRGVLLLFGPGKKSGSWKFPASVARIFAAINSIFVLFAAYFLHAAPDYIRLRYFAYILLSLLAIAWLVFLSKLYDQMAGIERVESFCWLFVPIRVNCLHEIDPHLEYHLRMVRPTAQPVDPKKKKSKAAKAGRAAK